MRGAEVRTLNESILKQPITKLFLIKYFKCQLDENVGENSNDNVCENMNENMCDNVVRPKRNVAIAGEILDYLVTIDYCFLILTDSFIILGIVLTPPHFCLGSIKTYYITRV